MITSLLVLALSAPAFAQLEVEEYTLDNGMTFLLLPRSDSPNDVAVGWVAHVGSANERPGITGISHFFEHMMFKGTNTIGTSDAEADAESRQRQEEVMGRLRALHHGEQYARYRRGEIDDPWDSFNDTEEMKVLRAELQELTDAQQSFIVPNEFDEIFRNAGAVGMNAFTTSDVTFFHVTMPSNRLELWCWMEADRLHDAVFREFYAERSVVHEERRQRIDSTPTGALDEQLDALFWTSSPYRWSVVGWPSDLNSYTLEDAQAYFDIYYAPNNLTGVMVGDFDPEVMKPMIDTYFGTLRRGPETPPIVTYEVDQVAERRMEGECDCSDQVQIRYHAPAFGGPDDFALGALGSLLSGRTGRLHKALVVDQQIASSVSAGQRSRPLGSEFNFRATVRGDATPDMLETAWYAEIERLKTELVSDRELQRVKNGLRAQTWRGLEDNMQLMIQLGFAEQIGGWRWVLDEPAAIAAVTPEDVRRVANTYFEAKNRTVATYRRAAGTAVDPEFAKVIADLPEELGAMLRGQLAELSKADDADELAATVVDMEAQLGQLPDHLQPAIQYMIDRANERLAALKEAK